MARRGLTAGLGALLLAACQLGTPGGAGGGATTQVIPTATSVGLAQGAAVGATIGPDGGALDGPGGAVRLRVPAGSVALPTGFTLRSISSRAPGALGSSWRIEADGPLAGPVQVTFRGLGAYRSGQDVTSLGIRVQDARGFWVAPDAVEHALAADTVTATTAHLSDWALVLAAAPALTGTFTLTQTVGLPFSASGTAALHAWSDAAEPTYLLTGTITLPPQLDDGGLSCAPDAQTRALELGVAEVHGAVFRWGLNARWALTCTDGAGGAVTSQDLATLFDTMQISLLRCAGAYLGTQVNGPEYVQGRYTSDCGAEGLVTASWDLRACSAGGACLPEAACRTGTVTCGQGAGSCTPSGDLPDGTPCATPTVPAGTCLGGGCR